MLHLEAPFHALPSSTIYKTGAMPPRDQVRVIGVVIGEPIEEVSVLMVSIELLS